MTILSVPPQLSTPAVAVKESYLAGEHADMVHRGEGTGWLEQARRDFDGFVSARVGVRERWGVPSEVFWFISGEHYIGSLVVRHELPAGDLGGHIGYHVVHPWQRRGHAGTMLWQARSIAADLGLEKVLLTVSETNAASLTVVARAGGVADGRNDDDELRFWIGTGPGD